MRSAKRLPLDGARPFASRGILLRPEDNLRDLNRNDNLFWLKRKAENPWVEIASK
jgi:hypothetical protein